MKPKVTISIPIYKCESSIEKCLLSVFRQTYQNIEVLLVNDQTQDNSVSLCEKFIAGHHLADWHIIHLEENGGLSVVRNTGIAHAAGKYIFFLDSDDEISANCIADMVALAEEFQLQTVVGEVEAVRLETGEKLDVFPVKVKEKILTGNDQIFKSFVDGAFPVSSWNKLIRLDFLRENQLYFTKGLFAQDALQSFQTALKLDSIGFLRKKTYIYYLHKNSVIHNRDKRHFDNWITIAKAINEACLLEKNKVKKQLILQHLVDFKVSTLHMNWKAQKNEKLWKESYNAYSHLQSLSVRDYFSKNFSTHLKKQNLFISLPAGLGFRFFKWRYER